MTIERARSEDLRDVRMLLERHRLTLDGIDQCVQTMLVARDEGRVVGSAALELYVGGALLRSIAVDPAFQRRNVGHTLVEAALELARQRGAQMVFLLTTTAERFFSRFGFESITRDEVPASVLESVEFRSACCASAAVMRRRL